MPGPTRRVIRKPDGHGQEIVGLRAGRSSVLVVITCCFLKRFLAASSTRRSLPPTT
jgi:hypothetical protein